MVIKFLKERIQSVSLSFATTGGIYIYRGVSPNEIKSVDVKFSYTDLIKSNQKEHYSYYESAFKVDYNKKLWILIYKQSTIDNHSWEEIQEQNLYDKRYSFTLDELNAMNWELVYNGN